MEAIWLWIRDNLAWLVPSSAVAAWLGKTAVSFVLDVLRERRAVRADQRKAATEFAHVADEYRRYWIKKHYDDLNAQPVEDHFVQWSGDSFDPLIRSECRVLHARLARPLKDQAFALDHRVKEAKEQIATLAEFREEDIDLEAPILVAEIAIAADQLYRVVMREAGLKPSQEYDSIGDIKRRLIGYRKEKERIEEINRKANEHLFEHREV